MNIEQIMKGMENLSAHGPKPPEGDSPRKFFERLMNFWRDANHVRNGSEQFQSQFEQFSQFVEHFAETHNLNFEGKSCQRKKDIQDPIAS